MRKKSIKTFITVVMMIFFIFCITQNVLAAGSGAFSTSAWDNASGEADTAAQRVMGTAINVIRIVGSAVAVIALVLIAIKYMSAAPTERAEFKKSATMYIVGAVLVFAASNILSIIQNFTTGNL